MSLSASHQNELNALIREITKAQPEDFLQFCHNYFDRRLESQRQEFLLHQKTSAAGGQNNKMAGNAFPGTATFGSGNMFGDNKKNVHSIEEEDEDGPMSSPTSNSYQQSRAGDTTQQPPSSFTSASPFGGGGFGGWGSGGSGTFATSTDSNGTGTDGPPSSFPSTFGDSGNTQQVPGQGLGRRTSVSAESLQPNTGDDNWRPPSHPKTDEQLARLKSAVATNFLFSHLDDDSFSTVLAALVEKPIPAPNIKVITQGDAGDYFYVVEKGEFDIYIHPSGAAQPGADGMGNKVASIGPGGSFGELALMYNAPRAATVVSKEGKSTLWALDRVTFRRILMDNAFQRRRMYEGFLEEVPLLSSLKGYERSKIADALESVKYTEGTKIINEGDPGDAFYLLESGEAEAFKAGVEKAVKEYTRGDYFGELALLDDKPRAASVIAKNNCKVAKLDRDGFKRLLGPVESIMRREEYDLDPLTKTTTVT